MSSLPGNTVLPVVGSAPAPRGPRPGGQTRPHGERLGHRDGFRVSPLLWVSQLGSVLSQGTSVRETGQEEGQGESDLEVLLCQL